MSDFSGSRSAADRSFAEVVAAVRPFVVGVRALAGHVSTGYVALDSGGVISDLAAVGFERQAEIIRDDGRITAARVVAADLARGVALLAPASHPGMLPLRAAPVIPALGAAVAALRRGADGALTVSTGTIAAVPTQEQQGSVRGIGAGAAVVVDADGRLLGLASGRVAGALLAAVSYAGLLAQLDMPLAQLARVQPVYRCARCREAFEPSLVRCLSCGAALPGAPALSESGAVGGRAVRDALVALGHPGAPAVTEGRVWRIRLDADRAVEIVLDDDGEVLVFRTPVSRLPQAGYDAVFRLLLTLNDATTGSHRLSLDGDVVVLSIAEAAVSDLERDTAALAQELVRHAEHYAGVLASAYGMQPARWD